MKLWKVTLQKANREYQRKLVLYVIATNIINAIASVDLEYGDSVTSAVLIDDVITCENDYYLTAR